MPKNKLKVGFDFDGVVAYNPFRIARPIIALTKRRLFGVKKLKFWYPQKRWQQIFWIILHESSVFPAKGVDIFKRLVLEEHIEAHLVTARYSFLDSHLNRWLRRYKLHHLFKTININKDDEQPHIFKEKMINKYSLDIYIEDNLDIVKYLYGKTRLPQGFGHRRAKAAKATERGQAKIYWIYNMLDKDYPYPHKHPHLKEALEEIMKKLT